MSTVVQPQPWRTVQGKTEVRVGLWNLVRAEITRSRRTFTWGVIGATLVFTAHTIILANASISSGVVALKAPRTSGAAVASDATTSDCASTAASCCTVCAVASVGLDAA